MYINELQVAIQNMCRDVKENVSKSQENSQKRHKMLTNIKKVNFWEGDFVLLRSTRKRITNYRIMVFDQR